MKRISIFTIVTGLLLGAWSMAAQPQNESLASQITEARKANAALMKQYTWECRTELVKEGSVLDTRIDQVQYGPDGKLQRIELNNESSSHPKGFLRKRIAEKKKHELEKYLTGLRELLDQYTLPSAGKVLDFVSAAKIEFVQAPDGAALILVKGEGVVVPGDTMSLWADASKHMTRKVQIATTYEGGVANVTATFKTKPSGLTYMSLAEVELPDKNLSLQVHNYDFEQND